MGKKSSAAAENVKVLVRCRPLSEKEVSNRQKSCVQLDLTAHTVTVTNDPDDSSRFTFDAVINNSYAQKDIFLQFVQPLADSVLDGFNATVFAYGQSGSGKTHTMSGAMDDPAEAGVIPRCLQYIFTRAHVVHEATPGQTYALSISFVELYNGKASDLLSRQSKPLDIREKDHAFYVQGAHTPHVHSAEEVLRLLDEGTERRRTAATDLNADSSRSHSIFTLTLDCTTTTEDGATTVITSKLNLVDLAGSERQGKSGASGDTLKEGCNINLSLSALGTVIDTIVKGAPHIPYRSSALTMLLKDSLGGCSKTVMFANISPSASNASETKSTLRFADRAKQIKNKPVVHVDLKEQRIMELTGVVKELREKLKRYETEGTARIEEEAAALRDRVGQLQVELDSAVKDREADRVEAAAAQAALKGQQRALSAQITELHEQVAQLQNSVEVAEANEKDARYAQNELLRTCASYLGDGEDITSVEVLCEVLRGVAARLKGVGAAPPQQHESAGTAAAAPTPDTAVSPTSGTTADLTETLKQLLGKSSALHAVQRQLAELRQRVESDGKVGSRVLEAATRAITQQPPSSEELLANFRAVLHGDLVSLTRLLLNQGLLCESLEQMAAAVQQATLVPLKYCAEPDNRAAVAAAEAAAVALKDACDGAVGARHATLAELHGAVVKAHKERDTMLEQMAARYPESPAMAELQGMLTSIQEESGTAPRAFGAEAPATVAPPAGRAADGECDRLAAECQRLQAAAQQHEMSVRHLEQQLRERAEHLVELRAVMMKQKTLIENGTTKLERLHAEHAAALAAAEHREHDLQSALEAKDNEFQRALNERLEALAEAHDAEAMQKLSNNKAVKKRMQKLQARLAALETTYDEKICECEELRTALEEQKLELIRYARRAEGSADQEDALESREHIQRTIDRVKSERQRKADLFAMGQVQNAKQRAYSWTSREAEQDRQPR